MKKNGFTLVELLAVIVILAIILAIAIPGISNMISASTKASAESDAKMVIKALEYKILEDDTFDPTTVNETNVASLLNIDATNYERLTVKKVNNNIYVTIVGKNKWNNLTISGTKIKTIADDTVTTFVRGANTPLLATGMTPIKWNGTTWVETTETDAEWYNYDTTNKIWANAQTEDGSMWVWIPRYIYRIPTANWHTNVAGIIDVQFTKGVDDNWNKSVIGSIDVGETANASNNKWTNHPAFTFGDTELTGIWVAKFKASAPSTSACYTTSNATNCNVTNLAPASLPNVVSWRNISISNIFTTVRNMETNEVYGWGTSGLGIDTHLMKNTEWGVVSYLAQSIYGINSEIYKNNSSSFYTGISGGNVGGSQVTVSGVEYINTGFYTYDGKCASTTTLAPGINANCTVVGATVSDTSLSYKASTTGNIYGIYDMSGGAHEYVAAYVDNGAVAFTTNGASILSAALQYKNVYIKGTPDSQTNNYALTVEKKGDAIYETSSLGTGSNSWNGDYSGTPNAIFNSFNRGNYYNGGSGTGSFSFSILPGSANANGSFRAIVVVGVNL